MKQAIIVIELVDESEEVSNEEIEAEILEMLETQYVAIPWMKNVKKVAVLKNCE